MDALGNGGSQADGNDGSRGLADLLGICQLLLVLGCLRLLVCRASLEGGGVLAIAVTAPLVLHGAFGVRMLTAAVFASAVGLSAGLAGVAKLPAYVALLGAAISVVLHSGVSKVKSKLAFS